MAEYTYHRGSQNSREAVEFDITRRGQYITTCVVDVDLLICGIKAFPLRERGRRKAHAGTAARYP